MMRIHGGNKIKRFDEKLGVVFVARSAWLTLW